MTAGGSSRSNFSYPALPLGLSPMVQEVVWTGRIRKHPRKNRFVYNAQDFKYLFIFELEEGNHIRIIRYLYDKLPQVHATREQDTLMPSMMLARTDATA